MAPPATTAIRRKATGSTRPVLACRFQGIEYDFNAEAVSVLGFAKNDESRYGCAVSYLDRITFNPEQCGGRPCIRGMRIRVKDVLEMLAEGASEGQILEDFPDLQAEDIRACLQYAAAQANHAILQVA